jgi:hypothetical protein
MYHCSGDHCYGHDFFANLTGILQLRPFYVGSSTTAVCPMGNIAPLPMPNLVMSKSGASNKIGNMVCSWILYGYYILCWKFIFQMCRCIYNYKFLADICLLQSTQQALQRGSFCSGHIPVQGWSLMSQYLTGEIMETTWKLPNVAMKCNKNRRKTLFKHQSSSISSIWGPGKVARLHHAVLRGDERGLKRVRCGTPDFPARWIFH